MRIFFICAAALSVALTALACTSNLSEQSEGCWITQANGIRINPQLRLTSEGEAIALSPGASYQIWCARRINESNIGNIISEDQQTLRISSMPHDTELRVLPNERDTVYRGQPVASSRDVWNGLSEASDRRQRYWVEGIIGAVVIAGVIAGLIIWRRKGRSDGEQVAYQQF